MKNRSTLIRESVKEFELVPAPIQVDRMTAMAAKFGVNSKSLTKELEFISRGIAFSQTGHRVDIEVPFWAVRIQTEEIEDLVQGLETVVFTGSVSSSDGVFSAGYAHTPENPNLFMMVSEFYGSVVFVTWFGAPELASSAAQ
jgi:hypothetical protein